jgi:dTDP-glucose 4,6-dehydratase
MKILVTGGRGFIGSHFVEECLAKGWSIVDVDKLTYASNKSLPWDNHKNYTFIKADISEIDHLPSCDVLINFAAESHVDNSIKSSDVFVKSNILGVHNLLELIRGKPSYDRPLFFHISTDEVYGDRHDGKFTEDDKLKPSNPYSATKAAAEMLVLSYHRTYGIDYLITRSSNNYGERQFEEKLIPKCLQCIKEDKKIPIHGDGSYVRDWTYVKDNVNALILLIEKNIKNDVFNIAAENYLTNLTVAKEVLTWYNKNENCIKFVENRWGQDIRYAVSSEKLKKATGWNPDFINGLKKFVG